MGGLTVGLMADEADVTLPAEEVANTTAVAAAETAESAGVDDLLSGPAVSVDDLMGDDIKVDRAALLDDADRAEGSGEAPLGVEALSGNLMSPRASPDPANPEETAETAAATAGGTDPAIDETAMSEAAVKIQTRQRGVRDRKRVETEKAEGNLPGQRRAVVAKPVHRESEKSTGDISFYDGIGSKYSGELLNGRPHGKGTYTFVNGNIYEGDLLMASSTGTARWSSLAMANS